MYVYININYVILSYIYIIGFWAWSQYYCYRNWDQGELKGDGIKAFQYYFTCLYISYLLIVFYFFQVIGF